MSLDVTVSQISRSQKDKHCTIPLIQGISNSQTHRSRVEWRLPGAEVRREWEVAQRVQSFCYTRWMSSRDLLYNIVSIVNNTVLCTSKYVKRLDLMLSVLMIKNKKQANHTRKFLEVMNMFSILIVVMVS